MSDLIKHMVDRFLGWKLPENFNPDGGISFKKTFNDHMPTPMKNEPTGTNLFDAVQAEAMVRHMLEGKPLGGDYRWLIEAPGEQRRSGSGKLRRVAPHTFEIEGRLRLRPEVLAFAQLMEQKLRANDHKAGWKSDAPGPLFDRMREEVNEAWQAMLKWPRDTKEYRDNLAGELADVANFAMMVADQNGCLSADK